MSKKVQFKLDGKGVRHLLYCQAMKDALQNVAHEVIPNADDYKLENMPTRSIVIITTEKGWFDNVQNNTLLKNMKVKREVSYVHTKNGLRYWRHVK